MTCGQRSREPQINAGRTAKLAELNWTVVPNATSLAVAGRRLVHGQ
jgi:hypothetical protein